MTKKEKWASIKHPSGKVASFPTRGQEDKSNLPQMEFPTVANKDTTQDPRYSEEAIRERAKKYPFGDLVVDGLRDDYTGWKFSRATKEASSCLNKIETGNSLQQIEAKVTLASKYPKVWKMYKETEHELKKSEVINIDNVYELG